MRASLLVAALAACGDNNQHEVSGWYSWLPSQGVDRDPHGIFRIDDGTIHILGTDLAPENFEFGYLASLDEYDDFRLHFEYKWGTRSYVDFARDSGVFVGVVGPDMLWPRSVECQVMEHDTGSVYIFDNATIETTIDPAKPDNPTYLEGGTPFVTPRRATPFPRVTHSAAYDSLTEWNTVEIIVSGEALEFIVNGNTTFRSTRRSQPDPAFPDDPTKDIPLTRGRLVIQEEGAEVMYRNITIE